jgi:ketosteroid isomerase-like protein
MANSPERKRNAQLFRDALDAWNRNDVAGVLALLDPAIESRVSPELMNAGTWRGLEGFGEMAAAWEEAWGESVYELIALETPDDDHVVAEVHQRATGAQSGVPVELTVFYLLEVADERAVRLHIYADRGSALAAIRSREGDGASSRRETHG